MIKWLYVILWILCMSCFIASFRIEADITKISDVFLDYIEETLKASYAQVR